MLTIDLNCDVGEGLDNDRELLKFVSSANIACGGHAGDKEIIRKTIELALNNEVAIGAHPSYVDKTNFGRYDLLEKGLSLDQLKNDLEEQLFLFLSVCKEFDVELHHIKLHGALYNRAARDQDLANFILTVINGFSISPQLYVLSGSRMAQMQNTYGMQMIEEVFADRTYQDDGSLTPRSQAGALIQNTDDSVQQVLDMVQLGRVFSTSKKPVFLKADTLCIHGDGIHAVDFVKKIYSALDEKGIKLALP